MILDVLNKTAISIVLVQSQKVIKKKKKKDKNSFTSDSLASI